MLQHVTNMNKSVQRLAHGQVLRFRLRMCCERGAVRHRIGPAASVQESPSHPLRFQDSEKKREEEKEEEEEEEQQEEREARTRSSG